MNNTLQTALGLLREIAAFYAPISRGWRPDAEPEDEFDVVERALAARVWALLADQAPARAKVPRFGTRVLILRGSGLRAYPNPGYLRIVLGTLTGARGNRIRARLQEDDPGAIVGPGHRGESGWWARSALVPICEHKGGSS